MRPLSRLRVVLLVIAGAYTTSSVIAGEREGAPLVLENTSTSTTGVRAGLRVTESAGSGIRVDSAASGVVVGSADDYGMLVNSARVSGFTVVSAVGSGFSVVDSQGDGILVFSADRFGGFFQGQQAGVRATATADANPDLVLSASSNANADSQGILASDPNYSGSDIVLRSNDYVEIELDSDGSGEDADLYVRDSANNILFNVDDSGSAFLAGTLVENSDVNAKQDLAPVDAHAILTGVLDTPVYRWAYRDDPEVAHVGPTAQDFRAAFEVGANDTSISTIDRDGVALASIQALHDLIERKDAQIAAQQAVIEDLATRVAALERAGR